MERNNIRSLRGRIESIEHWELFTLMFVTAVAILMFYSIALLILYPIFSFVSRPVYLLVALTVTILIGWGMLKRELRKVRSDDDVHLLSSVENPQIHNVLDEMCAELGMSKPELYIAKNEALNAFALGTRWDGVIVINSATYEQLDQAELEAIIGHELAHLYYFDSIVTKFSMDVESFIRRLAWVAMMIFNAIVVITLAIINGALGEGETQREAERRARIQQGLTRAVVGIAGALVLIPRNALSRYREFVADNTAATLIDDPEQMIGALEQLETTAEESEGSALNPVNTVETKLAVVYATHPSMDRRITVLEEDFTENDDRPTPLDEGPVLGSFTKFGLTVAPVAIISAAVVVVFR